jgi:hypothetical protein
MCNFKSRGFSKRGLTAGFGATRALRVRAWNGPSCHTDVIPLPGRGRLLWSPLEWKAVVGFPQQVCPRCARFGRPARVRERSCTADMLRGVIR